MVRAHQFISEASIDAVNELDLYINNNEDLYRKNFMPLVHQLNQSLKNNTYNHDNAIKKWNLLVNDAAMAYTKEFGKPAEDVKDFPAENTKQVIPLISKELHHTRL